MMREGGYVCGVTEHWNPHAHIRQDLFGFGDILCLGIDEVIMIQTTSYSNVSARVKKITEHENLAAVRKAGVRILVHGWFKNKSGRWEVKVVDIS